MYIELPHLFKFREYQLALFQKYFKEKIRFFYLLFHRRAGKDLLCFNFTIAAAIVRPGVYIYTLPQAAQARKVIWRGMTKDGIKFLDFIPPELVEKINESERLITLINGSIIYVAHSNNIDALIGSNPVGVVLSEYSLQKNPVLDFLKPIFDENGGWCIVQGTPRGVLHHSYDLWKSVQSKKDWFCQTVTIDDSKDKDGRPIITQNDIRITREMGVPESIIRQEYYCDFTSHNHGAVYGLQLAELVNQKRYCEFAVDNRHPVMTAWDIGTSDATAIWFFQYIAGKYFFVDYLEERFQEVQYFLDRLDEYRIKHRINYGFHFVPHDMTNRSFSSTKTAMQQCAQRGYIMHQVFKHKTQDGIFYTRKELSRCFFSSNNCSHGFKLLQHYEYAYNELTKAFSDKPKHDKTSHCADALRYGLWGFNEHYLNGGSSVHIYRSTL